MRVQPAEPPHSRSIGVTEHMEGEAVRQRDAGALHGRFQQVAKPAAVVEAEHAAVPRDAASMTPQFVNDGR